MSSWIYNSIWSNKFKSIALLILFPAILYIICRIVFIIMYHNSWEALQQTNNIFLILWPIIIIWWVISLVYQKNIIFKYTWAKEITRKDNPRIYNIVENLCISKWIQAPKIWIIEDSSMNAFATWRGPKDSWIVFTTWLINKLETNEIEAVAWHELTHILNRDCRLMAVIVIYVWIIGTLWSILIRRSYLWNRSSNSKADVWKILMIAWLVCLWLWYIFYPLMRLALSRKREYLADAGSVLLTKDKYSMISALQKISSNPTVESIQKDTIAAMCIENPLKKTKNFFSNLLSSHPSIEDRIKALNNY